MDFYFRTLFNLCIIQLIKKIKLKAKRNEMDIVRERYEIAIERIKEISTENISNENIRNILVRLLNLF